MLETLAQAIDETEIDVDGAALAEGYRLLDRLAAKLARAAGAFDRAGLWDLDDATSMPAWLRAKAGRTPGDAVRITRTARMTNQLPVTDAAWADGTLGSAQVEVITSHIGTRHLERFATDEAELVPLLAACDLAGTTTAMKAWRSAADDANPGVEPDEPRQSLYLQDVADRGVLTGDLAPDTTMVFRDALAVADSNDLDLPASQRRAEALEVISRFFLAHHDEKLHPRRRPRIALVVTPDQFATGDYGLELCDAAFHRIVVDGRSVTLDFGRNTRDVSRHQRELLDLRDHHCRWPGCDRPASWCDGHHVDPWENGGPTDLDNLVLLCRRHHRRLHRPGYRAKLLPDATFEITWPDGRTDRTDPPGILPQPFW